MFVIASLAGDLKSLPSGFAVNFFVVCFCVIGATRMCIGIWRDLKKEPTAEALFATKREIFDTNKRIEEVAEDLNARSKAAKESREKIYSRIEGLSREVGEMKATNDSQTQQLLRLNTQIDRLIDKLTK